LWLLQALGAISAEHRGFVTMLGFPWPSLVPAWRSSITARSKAAGRYLMTAPTMIQASVAMTTLPAKRSGKNSPQLRLRQGAVEGSEALMLM
jgi:hypothetical protein